VRGKISGWDTISFKVIFERCASELRLLTMKRSRSTD